MTGTGKQALQQVIFSVSEILSGELAANDALHRVLESICKEMGWTVGAFWKLHESRRVLVCEAFFSLRPFPNFERRTRQLSFERGVGLPGCVWRDKLPLWLTDLPESESFPRLAEAMADGLSTAFGFPVIVRGELVGVFEFFTERQGQTGTELLNGFAVLGAGLGQFFDRRRLQVELESAVRLQEYAAAIGSAVNELNDLPTIMEHCADISRRYLGARQVHIVVIDNDNQRIDYGPLQTDAGTENSLTAAIDLAAVLTSKQPLVLDCDANLIVDKGALESAGVCSVCAYPLIIDDTAIGAFLLFTASRLSESAQDACARAASYLTSCIARKQFEQSLVASEKRFRIFADNVDQCLFISAPQLTQHYYVSPAFEKIWGVPVAEVYEDASVWADSIVPAHRERVLDYVSRLTGSQMPEPEIEYQIRTRGGELRWLHVRIFAVVDRRDGTYHICGSVSDVTEKKLAEKRVSDFYVTVSHELRTPLTSIKGALLLLERRYSPKLPQKAKELALLARKECDRLIRLISNMLDFKKIEAGMLNLHREIVDPLEIIGETELLLNPIALERQVQLSHKVETSAKIYADRDRIVQVLTNLIANALRFCPPSTVVIVRAEETNNMVRFEVIDSGCGIAPERQKELFTAFQQVSGKENREGSGLGLAISKGIIAEHGGRIGVISDAGKGSTFWFELPLCREDNECD